MRCNSIFGCAMVLLFVSADARGAPIRVGAFVTGGNIGASQAINSGDVEGTYTTFSESTFNALSVAQLRSSYDVLLIGFDAPTGVNADFNTRIGPYLGAGGGVIFESPSNLGDIAAVASGPINMTGTPITVTAVVPGLTNGVTNNFLNGHMSFTSWNTSWLSQFLQDSISRATGLYGTYPVGGGRMVITGPDNDYHAVRGGPSAEANHYNLLVNELRWVTALQAPASTSFQWNVNALGNWTVGANWNPAQAPSTNQDTAVFGSVITAPRTVVVDSAVTVKAVEFNNVNRYAIAGTGSVNLEANTGSAAITVAQGTHEFQARVNLLDDTDSDVAAGAILEFNNRLSLGGNTLTKDGGGALLINNGLNTGGGTIVVLNGTVGGGGAVGGDLVNSAGTVAPGISPGILTVSGNYTQSAASTLAIELAGTVLGSQHDQLEVSGVATLDGTLTVNLLGGFIPDIGQSFTILSADDVDGEFTMDPVSPVPGLIFDVIYNPQSVVLTVSPAFTADFDEDGDVDAADLARWQGDFGANALSDADNDGDSDGDDFLQWQRQLGSPPLALPAADAVPEPGSATLMAAALFSVLARVRRLRR